MSSESNSSAQYQYIWVIRHGDRLDLTWKNNNSNSLDDTPLSSIGIIQSNNVATFISNYINGFKLELNDIYVSPYLRTLQTCKPLSQLYNINIKIENSIWETGKRQIPKRVYDQSIIKEELDINVDYNYKSFFTPEDDTFSTSSERLKKAAHYFRTSIPYQSNKNIAIFSHADPIAYLVAALCDIDPSIIAPICPCSIFLLKRNNDGPYNIVYNSYINHITSFGPTEPYHPIHSYYNFGRLFNYLRNNIIVCKDFIWPPKDDECLTALKSEWSKQYLNNTELIEGFIGDLTRRKLNIYGSCINPDCNTPICISGKIYYTYPDSYIYACKNCKCEITLDMIKKMIEHS